MADPLDARLLQRLTDLDHAGLTRHPPRIDDRRGVRYRVDGVDVVGFCSNDYLGLADDPALATTSTSTPSGASASRLICGDVPELRELEARLADLVDADDAVVFPSGFQLNVGVLPAVLDAGDHAYSDALNHASLIDGLRLARSPRTIVPHAGRPPTVDHGPGIAWWITESIFSMDGDHADPDAARAHLDAHGCLYLDEAHALGLFDGGRGWAARHTIRPTVLVGTLSKALGCAGAFAAGSRTLCTWLRARARSYVFSTGMSPVVATRVLRAVDLVRGPDGDARRDALWSNARRLAAHFGLPQPPSPIFPVLVGDNDRAVAIAGALLDRGWHVQPIRPPTVPRGTARLRLTVSAAHTPAQVDALARDLLEQLRRHRLPLCVERGRLEPLPPPATDPASSSAS